MTLTPMYVITGYTGPYARPGAGHPVVVGPVVPYDFAPFIPFFAGSCATGVGPPIQAAGYKFNNLGTIPETQCFRDMQSLVDAVFERTTAEAWRMGADAERKEWMGGK